MARHRSGNDGRRAGARPPGLAGTAPLTPALLALGLGLLAACGGRNRWPHYSTQRIPGPMSAAESPLPPGSESLYLPGPEEVVVVRHGDPVQVRPAGQSGSFPLHFYDKQLRVHAGSWVFCAAGGRAEILWPNGSSIVLFDRCTGVVGSPSRGEPTFVFYEVERAWLELREGDLVELLGGALLSAEAGPVVVERQFGPIQRVHDKSKQPCEVFFREEVFRLDPGQAVDLPLLSAGGRPIPSMPGRRLVEGDGFAVEVGGEAEVLESGARVRVRGAGEHEIGGLGLRVRLKEGEEVVFRGLGEAGGDSPAGARAAAQSAEGAGAGSGSAPATTDVPAGEEPGTGERP